MIGIDSTVIIDILRNKSSIVKIKRYSEEILCTSEIVVYEIYYGFYVSEHLDSKKLKEFEAVLDTFDYIFAINRESSIKSAQIAGKLSASGKIIDHRDILIAGSLLANGCSKFITKNTKDFERIKELEIIEY